MSLNLVIVGHQKWQKRLLKFGKKPRNGVLVAGSRGVAGTLREKERFSNAEYIGFNYCTDSNVDVVGDAHKLSSYFVG